jgi:DNA-binding MarR family transcriptional regulator
MSKPDSAATDRVRAHDDVLGYLLKHAHLALEQRTDAALADMGLTARDLGVLRVIAGGEARSQQEVAAVLGIDRTSMVALLDALECRGIVARRPSERDRRRNAVDLTQDGRSLFQRAEKCSTEAEQGFTAVLGDAGGAELRRALKAALDAGGRGQADPGDAAEPAGIP